MPGKRQRIIALFMMLLGILTPDSVFSQELQSKKLPDGVIRYYHVQKQKPYFFQLYEKFRNVWLPDANELPFGKSVAFLVGVSDYEKPLSDLPFVKNDLDALRDYLLRHGGFDEVYVAADDIVTNRLIERYMFFNQFQAKLGARDRLLFY